MHARECLKQYLQMGSVPDDHRCRVCGRVGNGGYLMDGYFRYGPICTGEISRHSCLWQLLGPICPQPLQFVMRGRLEPYLVALISDFFPEIEPDDYIAQTLSRAVLRKMRPQLPYKAMKIIANFII